MFKKGIKRCEKTNIDFYNNSDYTTIELYLIFDNNRLLKLVNYCRLNNPIINQTYENWELIIKNEIFFLSKV